MPRVRNGSEPVRVDSKNMTARALALSLGVAMADSLGGHVARVRLVIWPDKAPAIQYYHELSAIRGVPTLLWPDEPGFDGQLFSPTEGPTKIDWVEDSGSYVAGDGGSTPMSAYLARIKAWLSKNVPALLEQLNPPATAERIAEWEERLGVTAPCSVREAWLVHDGEIARAGVLKYDWLSLDASEVEMATMGHRPDGGVGLIPIMQLGPDVAYVKSVDSREADSQLWLYASGDNMEWLLADSFRGYLAWFADACEQGKIIYEDDHLWRDDEY